MSTSPFAIGSVSAAPGTAASGVLEISARPAIGGLPGDGGTTIPITIVHGRTPGPVLALVAGVHGMEYIPILALLRAAMTIDPGEIRGTVILVHAANMPSFLGRTIYYSPVDGKNLNRVFPGRPDGTLSERIAHCLTTEIVSRATHLVDLHGGDGNESLRRYTYWITSGRAEVSTASRGLALAFGLDRIVVDRGRPTNPATSLYLSNTAITRGIPAITTEIGGLGRVDRDSLALAARGITGVLRHVGIRSSGPPPIAAPLWVTREEVLRAGHTGLFHPKVDCGVTVQEGDSIGVITDFFGHPIEDVHAPFAGEVLYVVLTPPVTSGEPLAMVGVTSPSSD